MQLDHGEVIWRSKYENNAVSFGLCNCGLMYDRENVFETLESPDLLGMKVSELTHVVANPANVAGWAIKIKFKGCKGEAWHDKLVNKSNKELFEWNPFPTPTELRAELEAHGFKGKLIWTLPFWCRNRSQANIYRRPPAPGLLESGLVDGLLDTSEFICPEEKKWFRCQEATCSKSHMGQHQCLPGPPDDMAASLMHLLHTV
jgi:hypothetical protein